MFKQLTPEAKSSIPYLVLEVGYFEAVDTIRGESLVSCCDYLLIVCLCVQP